MTSTACANIQLQITEHTALVTLTNPPAHVWTRESLAALKQLVLDLNADANVRSLIITGQGEKFFSAGADLKLFADGNKDIARAMALAFGDAFETLSRFRGVSIAAINGYAMGGGLECALACDIRIAEEHVQLALPESGVGLLPCGGGTQTLSWLVGEGWAKRMILCGERLDAATAVRIGLIEEVTRPGTSLARAKELAAAAARQSPGSLAACKQLIQGARQRPMDDMLAVERQAFVDLFGTFNQTEGVRAFIEKRTPKWQAGV